MSKQESHKAIALLALAQTMLHEGIDAEQATANIYDTQRINRMMQNGLDKVDAKKMLEVSPQSLVVGE